MCADAKTAASHIASLRLSVSLHILRVPSNDKCADALFEVGAELTQMWFILPWLNVGWIFISTLVVT